MIGFTPKPMRKSGERRRAAVLRAAARVFLERGFERTSLTDILAHSGGSRRTIYEQFQDKEGLFEAIMEDTCAHMLLPMRDPVLLDGDPEQMLRRIAWCFLNVMTTPTVASLRRIAMGEGRKFPRIARIFVRSGVDPAIAHVADAFQRLNAQGFQFHEPDLAAVMFLSMVQGDAIDRLTIGSVKRRQKAMLQRQVDFAVAAVLRLGIK